MNRARLRAVRHDRFFELGSLIFAAVVLAFLGWEIFTVEQIRRLNESYPELALPSIRDEALAAANAAAVAMPEPSVMWRLPGAELVDPYRTAALTALLRQYADSSSSDRSSRRSWKAA